MKKTTVVLADPHPVVRAGLKAIFLQEPDIEVVAETDNGETLLPLTLKHQPDLLLLEMTIPGCSTPQLLQQLERRAVFTAVLVVSSNREEQYAASIMQAGARGFLHKTRPVNEILQAIRTIAEGGVYLSSELARHIALCSVNETRSGLTQKRLTRREQEILIELANGSSVTGIAQRLHLSPKTVSTHKTRIFHKLGIQTTFDLVRYTLEHGFS